MMIVYTPPSKSEEPELMANVWNYISLCLNPILVAYGTVQMRQMRKLNENVVSCYMNSSAIFVMLAICYGTGNNI